MVPDYTNTAVNAALSNETFQNLLRLYPVLKLPPFIGDQMNASREKKIIQLVWDSFKYRGIDKNSDVESGLEKVMLRSIDKISSHCSFDAETAKDFFLAHISYIGFYDRSNEAFEEAFAVLKNEEWKKIVWEHRQEVLQQIVVDQRNPTSIQEDQTSASSSFSASSSSSSDMPMESKVEDVLSNAVDALIKNPESTDEEAEDLLTSSWKGNREDLATRLIKEKLKDGAASMYRFALKFKEFEFACFLLKAGVRLEKSDMPMEDVLSNAVDAFIENPEPTDQEGDDLLMDVWKQNRQDLATRLIKEKLKDYATDTYRFALKFKEFDYARFFLRAGLSLEKEHLVPTLDFLYNRNDFDTMLFAMKNISHIDFQDETFQKVLKTASLKKDAGLVKFLLDSGVPVKNDGYSVIHDACIGGNSDIVRMLIEKGADVNLYARHYGCPLRIAYEKKFLDIARILLDNGASLGD